MKILLALDSSILAIDEAVSIARARQAELTALFIVDHTWNEFLGHDWLSGSRARAGFLEYVRADELAEAQRLAAEFRSRAEGIDYRLKTAAGRVTTELCRELAQGYDLLVLGYPFRRGLEILRNPLAKILKKAPCSILLVKSG